LVSRSLEKELSSELTLIGEVGGYGTIMGPQKTKAQNPIRQST